MPLQLVKNDRKIDYQTRIAPSSVMNIALKVLLLPITAILTALGLLLKAISFVSDKTRLNLYRNFQYTAISERRPLNALYKESITQGMLDQFYKEIISNPLRYLNKQRGSYELELPFNLSECACGGGFPSGGFDRGAGPHRFNIEQFIIKDVLERFPKDTTLSLLSLGCGGMLEDWIIVGKLIDQGYRKIDLVLVDPKIDITKFKELQNFYEELKAYGITVNVQMYTNVQGYRNTGANTIDAVISIDYASEGYVELQNQDPAIVGAKECLKKSGRFYITPDAEGNEVLLTGSQDASEAMPLSTLVKSADVL